MNNGYFTQKLKGFSLFELLVTMGILLLITTLVFPITLQKTQKTKLETYTKQLVTDLYYQQQRSSLKEINGGVQVQNNGYIIFDGNNISEASDVQRKSYPTNISLTSINLSSGNEIIFRDGDFKPSSFGSLIITDGMFSTRVYINREGLIEYEIL